MSAVSGEVPRSGRFPVLAKYDVLEELGHGGMATVYRAHDKRLGRDVAVKVIHPHLRDSGEIARRFSIEAQAVAKLRHANIVEVFDVSAEGEGEQYLVVELLRGRTLRKMLQTEGAMPPEVAAAIGVELLSALAHAHGHGVVHRDVKPENVIIEHRAAANPASSQTPVPAVVAGGSMRPRREGEPGDRISVKLTDFGIAKLLDAQGMTSTGQVLGSPAHMAPEQIEGQDVDARADVFGMGVLLYECMVGHLPFEGNNPAQVLRRVLEGVYPSAERERPTIGRVFSLILDKALGRTPAERYDDANAMRDALDAELSRLGVTNPRAEIEAYCDDPKAYAAQHEKRTVALLCDRALEARKRGDAMAAAADYNRALAYAPHDPALLRIVSSLHGAEQRRRFVRRAAPLLLGTLLLGALAFGVTRELRGRVELQPDAIPTHTNPVDPPSVLPTLTSVIPGTSVAGGTASPVTPPTPQIAKPPVNPPATKAGAREIHFSSVSPQNIVEVWIDNNRVLERLAPGATLTFPFDDQPHDLKFACASNFCTPKSQHYDQGQSPALSQSVHLDLKDAQVKLKVSPNSSYALDDDGFKLTEGNNSIPMTSPNRAVTVREFPSNKSKAVRLFAGATSAVDAAEFELSH
jgi:eukaryotic-like serine/threonine-protein kinase